MRQPPVNHGGKAATTPDRILVLTIIIVKEIAAVRAARGEGGGGGYAQVRRGAVSGRPWAGATARQIDPRVRPCKANVKKKEVSIEYL